MSLGEAIPASGAAPAPAFLRGSTAAWGAVGLVIIVAGLLVAHLARIAVRPTTFWLDEAMLIVNVQAIGWGELLRPLPLYDQAAPLLYLALLKAVHAIAGLSETALRLPSWLAAAGAVALAFALPRLSWTERCLVAAALTGSDVLARTATDVKPYAADVLAAMALICAFHPDATPVWRRWPLRLGLLAAALLGAASFPLTAFAVGIVHVLWRPIDWRQPAVALPAIWRAGWPFALALPLYAAYYLTYVAPSFGLVLANYAYAYEAIGFNHTPLPWPMWFLVQLRAIVTSHFTPVTAVAGLAVLLGIFRGVRTRSAYAAQAGALVAIMAALNALHLYPVIEDRFTLFVLPWLAVLAALGVTQLLELLEPVSPMPARAAVAQAIALAAGLALVWPAVDFVRDPHHQHAGRSLAVLHADPNTPVVTSIAAQPILELHAPGAGSVLVRDAHICRPEIASGTTDRCTRARAPGDGAFAGADTKWYLLNYAAVAGWDGESFGFPGASLPAFVAEYHAWLTAEVARHPRAWLLLAQQTPRDIARLTELLAPHGRLTLVADDRPPSPSRGWGAARLFLFERHGTAAP